LSPIPLVTKVLLWAIGIAFLLQQLNPDVATIYFALWPIGDIREGGQVFSPFQPWQLLTYAFLHGNFIHLFFNALMLMQFGGRLEYSLGRKRYIQFLVVCAVGAGLCELAVMTLMLRSQATAGYSVGASGYIYGIMLAWAVLWPRERVMMILPPIEMSVRTMVMVFGGISLFMGVTGTGGGVAHFAHLGGMLGGLLMIRYWRGQVPFGRRR
jgi:membrane associated rhomboid family serine protease